MESTHVVQATVGADGAAFLEVSLLRDDGGDTAGGQAGRSGTDQDGELLEELSLLLGGLDTEEVGEDANDGQELFSRVAEE